MIIIKLFQYHILEQFFNFFPPSPSQSLEISSLLFMLFLNDDFHFQSRDSVARILAQTEGFVTKETIIIHARVLPVSGDQHAQVTI